MTACTPDRGCPREPCRSRPRDAGPRVVEEQPLALSAEAYSCVSAEDGEPAHALLHVHEGGAEAAALGNLPELRQRGIGRGETGGDARGEAVPVRRRAQQRRARGDDSERSERAHRRQYAHGT